ncbi:putative transcriptional regulator [Psychrobacillus insolitus]|uniref:Putative transcriptional regulator n=1 Tax=Psychrobacillus insolitus TaxID=1461 RepID=A0A2W7MM56_9BACI|nr:helix-turn-helix transcriptional regulator [Psychrobacillus insolitus]PZX07945.1 putative transcriptional regulator [Psychrobacillus insolitus]
MNNNIADIRKSKGISQKELAEMIGVSANWMNHIEKGKRRPSTKTLEKIAEMLQISIKDIFLE